MADGKIVATLKGGAGYDAPWIVVSGDTPVEVQDNLKNIAAIGLYGDVVAAAQLFGGAVVVPTSAGVPQTAGASATQGASAAPSSPPASTGTGRFCSHGPRVRRSGTSTRGAWVGHFCGLPKDHPDRCKPEYED